jgi:hypothetical protein
MGTMSGGYLRHRGTPHVRVHSCNANAMYEPTAKKHLRRPYLRQPPTNFSRCQLQRLRPGNQILKNVKQSPQNGKKDGKVPTAWVPAPAARF